jgi:hypothetical protein
MTWSVERVLRSSIGQRGLDVQMSSDPLLAAPVDVTGETILLGDEFWYAMPAGRGAILCKYKAIRFYMSSGEFPELMLEAEVITDLHYGASWRTRNGRLHCALFPTRALRVTT